MITEEELYDAAHARFGGSEIQDSACRGAWMYGANWAFSQMNEGTTKADDWSEVSELLPPVNIKVGCAIKLPGLVCKAWLFDIIRNEGEAYARFLVDDPDKIIFICPKYWRFVK